MPKSGADPHRRSAAQIARASRKGEGVAAGPTRLDEHLSPGAAGDPREPISRLLRDLRSRPEGLSSREAERRLTAYGPNELRRRGGRRWPRQLAQQFMHPLALLLWLAAVLAFVAGIAVARRPRSSPSSSSTPLFAFAQERQAERGGRGARPLPAAAGAVRETARGRRSTRARSFPATSSSRPRATGSRPTRACSRARSRSTCRR